MKSIGIFFVINQPLIEKFKPYNMPLLPHKNVFFLESTNKYMNIKFCYFWSLSAFTCKSWWFANISSCRSFIYVKTYKHDNYIYFWLFLQSIHFQVTCHDILQLFRHRNGCFALKLPKTSSILFFWKWFTFSCKTYNLSLFPHQIVFLFENYKKKKENQFLLCL